MSVLDGVAFGLPARSTKAPVPIRIDITPEELVGVTIQLYQVALVCVNPLMTPFVAVISSSVNPVDVSDA